MKARFAFASLFLSLALGLTACGAWSAENSVSLNGSTSMDRVVGALNERFMLDHSDWLAVYEPTGSGAGIQAVRTGTCDIGLSSRHLKDSERAAGLTDTVLALDSLAVVVHPDNPVADLSLSQLAQVYTGRITDWSQVGGSSGAIAVVGREAGSGTREGFETAADVVGTACYTQELTSTGAVLEAVKANPNAIGYASLASVGTGVKTITIDGVPCTPTAVLDGAYPIQRPFLLVTRADTVLSDQAQAWFDFATGTDAASIITNAGAIPTAVE